MQDEKLNNLYLCKRYKYCIFGLHNIRKGGLPRLLLVAGFLIAATQILGSEPPRRALMRLQPLRCYVEGKAEPLFISGQAKIFNL